MPVHHGLMNSLASSIWFIIKSSVMSFGAVASAEKPHVPGTHALFAYLLNKTAKQKDVCFLPLKDYFKSLSGREGLIEQDLHTLAAFLPQFS